MNNINNKFVIIWGTCLVVLLFVCFLGFDISLRGTHAYFGDGTSGSLTAYSVTYNSNYPDDVMLDETEQKDQQRTNFNKLLDNMFVIPDGYKFVGWYDVDAVKYLPGDVKFLKSNVILYAEWVKNDEAESDNVETGSDDDLLEDLSRKNYGDVNLNGLIDEDDYKLILSYVDGSGDLDDRVLINADVNDDKKVDLVDVDIIKNAFLGTSGYVGFLPEKPILIYDIYEGNIGNGTGGGDGVLDSNEDNETSEENFDSSGDSSNNDSNSSVSGSGGFGNGSSGNGGTGGGGTSGGTSSGNANSSGSDNSDSSNDQSTGDLTNNKLEEENDENEDSILENKILKFKYMNGLTKYDSTSCETTSGSCMIVLPSNTPVREGYTFKGWSNNRDCKGKDLIVSSVSVDSGDTYYACYLKNVDYEEEGNKYYIWIIVFLISGLSLRLIWHVIYKFRHEEDNDEEMKWLK